MAKRKGKSRRRVKGWQERLAGGEDVESMHGHQRLAPPAVKLPPRELEAGSEALDDLVRVEGMVVGQFPGGALVRTDQRVLQCNIAKTFRAPPTATALAVGDIVTVALAPQQVSREHQQSDKVRSDGMILSRQPRRTALARPQPRSGKRRDEYDTKPFEKVIAANMDLLLIVAATRQPPLRHGLIDRYLIIAQRGEMDSLLVLNKIDLGLPQPKIIEEFAAMGLESIACSALTGEGLDDLRNRLAGRRSVMAGASGVGKSTLINALVPAAEAAVGSIRAADERGRHTTTSVSVYDLPEGGLLLDTPGIRELALRLDPAELPWFFPEFIPFAQQCRFRDCTHTHEPGCEVARAAEADELPRRRYESYLRLLETLEG